MPAARDNPILLPIIFLSMGASVVFRMLPVFDFISPSMKVIILTLVISLAAAVLFPVREDEDAGQKDGGADGGRVDGGAAKIGGEDDGKASGGKART